MTITFLSAVTMLTLSGSRCGGCGMSLAASRMTKSEMQAVARK
jgi:predicted  nucleic acid-binding Zn-ribbon protein